MHYLDAVASAGPCWKKPVRHPRQITTRTPHHLVFTGRMLFLMPNQLCQALKAGSFNVHTKASRSQCNSTMWNRNFNRKVKRHKIKNTDLLGSNHSYLECLESFLGEKGVCGGKDLWKDGFEQGLKEGLMDHDSGESMKKQIVYRQIDTKLSVRGTVKHSAGSDQLFVKMMKMAKQEWQQMMSEYCEEARQNEIVQVRRLRGLCNWVLVFDAFTHTPV